MFRRNSNAEENAMTRIHPLKGPAERSTSLPTRLDESIEEYLSPAEKAQLYKEEQQQQQQPPIQPNRLPSQIVSPRRRTSRIPASLRDIFIASAKGEVVDTAPADNSGWKVFKRDKSRRQTKQSHDNFKDNSFLKKSSSSISSSPTPLSSSPSHDGKKSSRSGRRSSMKQSDHTARSSGTTKSKAHKQNPQAYLNEILEERGYSTKTYKSLTCAYHCKPSELQQASYGVMPVEAVRNEDVSTLKELFDAGLSPNPCNVFGESLIHMACRRGSYKILDFMLDYGSTMQTSDDFGRTPLHDACWTAHPNFNLVSLLLKFDLDMLKITDGRNATPLSYVAKKSWVKWIAFLDSVKDEFWPQRDTNELGIERAPPLTKQAVHSIPAPEPHRDLSIDMAFKIASGAVDVHDPWLTELCYEDDETLSSTEGEDDDETIYSRNYDDPNFLTEEEIMQTLSKYSSSGCMLNGGEDNMVSGVTACVSDVNILVDRAPSAGETIISLMG